MTDCPVCQAELKEDQTVCPVCDTDLAVVREMDGLPARFERAAREALASGAYESALKNARSLRALKPEDAEAARLEAKAQEGVGDRTAEAAAWRELLLLAPEDPEATARLAELETPVAAPTPSGWNWRYPAAVLLILGALVLGWTARQAFQDPEPDAAVAASPVNREASPPPVEAVEPTKETPEPEPLESNKKSAAAPIEVEQPPEPSREPTVEPWSKSSGPAHEAAAYSDPGPGASFQPGAQAALPAPSTEPEPVPEPTPSAEEELAARMAEEREKKMAALRAELENSLPAGLRVQTREGGVIVSGAVSYAWDKQQLERRARSWECGFADLTGVRVEYPGAILYRVKSGDTLCSLARLFLGESDRWPDVYSLNQNKIVDPNLLEPGMDIIIPGPG